MRFHPLFTLLAFLSIFVISCNDEARKNARKERLEKDRYFESPEEAVGLDSFSNELGDDHTDFLRSFGEDQIAWQKWNPSLLDKAKSAQSPIMALVGSSLGGASRNLGIELSEDPELRKIVTNQSVCTVIDTLVYPEIGILSYHLSNELKRATTFPTLVWLSHEGSPLAWIPIGELSGRELNIVVSNATAMVEDIWTRYSDYAVENSRSDNESRQRRLDLAISGLEEPEERDEIFRRSTRQLSSLYSFGDRDLDYIGGLIPTNSLELLALGSQSSRLTDEVRERCRKAVTEVTWAMTQEAIKDHLDGSYFFARRTTDWSLPAFSKDVSSQARMAHMLIRIGSILENQTFLNEGYSVLSTAENQWLAQSISSRSPADEPDKPGKFFWDLETIEKVLSEEEIQIAVAAFSLQGDGNIPAATDPLDNYYQLNTLRRRKALGTLSTQFGKPEEDLSNTLSAISKKLLEHREKITKYDTESTFSLSDFALILKAQLARAGSTRSKKDLETALKFADRILEDFYDSEKGLSRLPLTNSFITARCIDYANTTSSLLLVYQATLDEKWLTLSLQILDEAISKLASENGLLSEIPNDDRIIPIRQHSSSMIFGESSLGILDLSLNRAWTITGDEKYSKLLEKQRKSLAPTAKISPVNHTDFIASCALGSQPLLAVIDGNLSSPNARTMLSLLNSQKHLPFLSIRTLKPSDKNLQNPEQAADIRVTLVREGQPLGSASTEPALEKLLNQIVSGD